MLPDCTGEYNNASALPGERNITLFTARLCPEKRREKQPVSLADGTGAKVIAKRGTIIGARQHAEAVQHYLLLPTAFSELRRRPAHTPLIFKCIKNEHN